MDMYLRPNTTLIIPLVRGTVASHKTPSKAAKIKIVISFFGTIIKIINRIERKEQSTTNKFFFDILSPSLAKIKVPKILNNPINAKDQLPIQEGKLKSSKYAGK